MRPIKERSFVILILVSVFVVYTEGRAQVRSNGDLSPIEVVQAIDQGKTGDKGRPQEAVEAADKAPNIGDIIPLATKLSARAAALENDLKAVPDLTEMQRHDERIEKEITKLSAKLDKHRGLEAPRYQKLLEIKQAIRRESDLLQKNDAPLKEGINRLQSLRNEWFLEKERWNRWQEAVMKNGGVEKLKPVFSQAEKTIDRALLAIEPQSEKMLARQEKSAVIQSKIDSLIAEVDGLIMKTRQETALGTSPPMFSAAYVSQFRMGLLYKSETSLASISWMRGSFFARQGWVVAIQLFITILLIVQIYRHRTALRGYERLSLLSARPFSAGLYLGIMTASLFYDLRGAPAVWRMAQVVIGGIAFARLWAELVQTPWKKTAVYTLIVVLALNRFCTLITLPLPLARLYVLLVSVTGLLLCLRWARRAAVTEGSVAYVYALRIGAIFLGYVALAEIWGQGESPQYLFVSAISTLSILIGFIFFMYLVRGALEWFVCSVTAPRMDLSPDEAEAVVKYTVVLIDAVILGILLCVLLVNWGVFETLGAAAHGISNLGFSAEATSIRLGSVISAVVAVYAAFIVSRLTRRFLINRVLKQRLLEKGVILSISGLLHYALLLIGFLFALMLMGFDLTKITIILSALGVGIGFGMQNIANNFISGLILLIERPVRVGDYIELSGTWAEIKRIGLRATRVATFDNADVIVPNAELVTNRVTNWTLSSRVVRISLAVGVAYGSDIAAVTENLWASAAENPRIAKVPAPQVLFLRFGESSLDFKLRVWVRDVDDMLVAKSELHTAICSRFRDANIEIAFPQRDLRLRSVDASVRLASSGDPLKDASQS